MALQIPSLESVQNRLLAMSHAELQQLARNSGVPFGTLWKIRAGTTTNPRMGTLAKFWPIAERRRTERA
jgi:predicted transcriptional regulator